MIIFQRLNSKVIYLLVVGIGFGSGLELGGKTSHHLLVEWEEMS